MSHQFECTFKGETAKAVCVVHHATGEELWFPFSQVDEMHKDGKGEGYIVVSDWIAQQKGLT